MLLNTNINISASVALSLVQDDRIVSRSIEPFTGNVKSPEGNKQDVVGAVTVDDKVTVHVIL